MRKTKANVDEICEYIAAHNCTVRQAAEHFGICKSTIHNYCRRCGNDQLKSATQRVLSVNLADRSRRGGLAKGKRKETVKDGENR